MSEIIESIENVENIKPKKDEWISCDGFEVKTNKQTIRFLISNGQSCCESWGYFMSEEDPRSFVGATLLDLRLVNSALKEIRNEEIENLDQGSLMFVNLETDRGTLQFTAYNSHNGYYGHSAYVESEQLNHETCL